VRERTLHQGGVAEGMPQPVLQCAQAKVHYLERPSYLISR
jgi:hypothetical protein